MADQGFLEEEEVVCFLSWSLHISWKFPLSPVDSSCCPCLPPLRKVCWGLTCLGRALHGQNPAFFRSGGIVLWAVGPSADPFLPSWFCWENPRFSKSSEKLLSFWNVLEGLQITLFSTKYAVGLQVRSAEGTELSLQLPACSCAESASWASWIFPWPVLEKVTLPLSLPPSFTPSPISLSLFCVNWDFPGEETAYLYLLSWLHI